jgi:hypothetical protein
MSDILFVRPADDSTAITVAGWGYAVLLMASAFQTDDLNSAQATRQNVDNKLAAGFRSLFYFGHGTDAELIGHGQALVDSTNIGTVGGGVVVAIACYAAISLGPCAGPGQGAEAFLGFDDEFGFPAAAPLPMQLAVHEGLRGLVTSGSDIATAADDLRAKFDDARVDYKNNGVSYGLSAGDARTAWLFAKSNRHSVRVHGDGTATL